MRTRALVFASISAGMLWAACTTDVGGFSGKTCETANDCPPGLVCVQSSPVPTDPKTCEALALPPTATFAPVDAGFADYCHDVKPILDNFCISCHSVPPTNGAPPTLRLDTYDSVGGIPGARESAARINERAAVQDNMPPGMPLPQRDQDAITAWFRSGAPFCVDGGTVLDGGM